jgi:hypothetical protein
MAKKLRSKSTFLADEVSPESSPVFNQPAPHPSKDPFRDSLPDRPIPVRGGEPLWQRNLPQQLVGYCLRAAKEVGLKTHDISFEVVPPKDRPPLEEYYPRLLESLKIAVSQGQTKNFVLDLTRIAEPRDPRQMGDKLETPADAIRRISSLKARLEQIQEPVVEALELFLHDLPSVRFTSLQERQDFENSLAEILARLDKRIARYDEEHKAPLKEDEPSRLRCNPSGNGYFRLEFFREGRKVRPTLGPQLPALTLQDPPTDQRKR